MNDIMCVSFLTSILMVMLSYERLNISNLVLINLRMEIVISQGFPEKQKQ